MLGMCVSVCVSTSLTEMYSISQFGLSVRNSSWREMNTPSRKSQEARILFVICRVCLCLCVRRVSHCNFNFGITCQFTLLSYSSAFMPTGAFPTPVINIFINLLWTRKYVGFRSQELCVRARESYLTVNTLLFCLTPLVSQYILRGTLWPFGEGRCRYLVSSRVGQTSAHITKTSLLIVDDLWQVSNDNDQRGSLCHFSRTFPVDRTPFHTQK